MFDPNLKTILEKNWQDWVYEPLRKILKIPSVSTRGEGIYECAETLVDILKNSGFETELWQIADAYPVVFASKNFAGADKTLIFYNHYDVQPEDPLNLWHYNPFDLSEDDGKLYGRGVADDKGHIIARLASILLATHVAQNLKVNIKWLMEGEEEIGSPNLHRYIEKFRNELNADFCIWESGGVDFRGAPELYMGMKGIITVEIHAKGPSRDLHSSVGVLSPNPIWLLTEFLSQLRDNDGYVKIPGFYDDVLPPTPDDERAISTIPLEKVEQWKKEWGVKGFVAGVDGREAIRKLLFEPTININGIYGGYTGPGSKTVLPGTAYAKIDIRLVPDQKPEDIYGKLISYKDSLGIEGIEIVPLKGMEAPARTPLDHPFVGKVRETAKDVYGEEPVLYPLVPGSGPMALFTDKLGLPVVGCGVGYEGSRAHSPDENIRLSDLKMGIIHVAHLLLSM